MRHSSFMEVSLGALSRNFEKIKKLAPTARILPMVKGDAYGHGVVRVSKHLTEQLGVTRLGVASLHEAVTILNALPDFAQNPRCEVVVFSDTEIHSKVCRERIYNKCGIVDDSSTTITPGASSQKKIDEEEADNFFDLKVVPCQARVIPVIGTIEDLRFFLGGDAAASGSGVGANHITENSSTSGDAPDCFRRLPLFIKLNTGMNRMGITPAALLNGSSSDGATCTTQNEDDFIQLIKEKRDGKIDLLMQHFSSSWYDQHGPDGATTKAQYQLFKDTKKRLQETSRIEVRETSVSNSGAIEQQIGVEETWVRPGLMLYGAPSVVQEDSTIVDVQNPNRYQPIYHGEVVGSLISKIINIYSITAADVEASKGGVVYVGYGFNPVRGPCVIVLLPIGYADGFLRYNTGLRIQIQKKNNNSNTNPVDSTHDHTGVGIDGVVTGEVHGFVNMDITQLALYPGEHGNPTTLEGILSCIQQEQQVTIWGHTDNRDIHAKAIFLSTNAYQLLTAVSVRIPRKYISGGVTASDGGNEQ